MSLRRTENQLVVKMYVRTGDSVQAGQLIGRFAARAAAVRSMKRADAIEWPDA